MPGGLTTTLTIVDDATPPLLRLGRAVRDPAIRKVMGRAVAGLMRKHFTKLDGERANKMGGERTHFYGQARRGVQQPELVGGDGVKVSTNHVGIAQRYFGGDIVPRSAHWLTIPLVPEAYGHRAREFPDLQFVPGEDGRRAWLVRDTSDQPGGMPDEFFYLLVRRVHQEPDPTVLPPPPQTQAVALQAGEDHMSLLLDRARN